MAEERTTAEDDATAVMPGSGRDLRIGDVLKGRFELVETLGRGGMGQVFKAIDRNLLEAKDPDHFVAVKVLGDAFRRHPNSGVAFEREAKKAKKLSHDNICRVHDYDKDGEIRFMTMEYLSGRSLENIVNNEDFKGLPIDKAIAYLAPICDALDYAHNSRPPIVHYDLKPGNIFCTDKGLVKLIDFGIARAVKGEDAEQTMMTEAVVPALSPRYASPEMLEGDEPDRRDDIYALGCVAYILLTGRHPFGTPATAARDQRMAPERPEGLDNRAWAAICRALAFERSKRTPTAGAFLADLRGAAGDGRSRRRAGVAAAGIVALAMAGVGGYFAADYFAWFNTDPVAVADRIHAFQGRTVEIDVLSNDTDADGHPLTVTDIVIPPRSGTARIEADGQIHYRPTAGFIGSDRFLYTVDDGNGGTATAEVTVTVAPPPSSELTTRPLPEAADDRIETTAGSPRDLQPLGNDRHPAGEPLALDRIVAPPRHGRAAILDPRTIRYTPDPGYVGADAFSYGVIDPAGERASARVIVTVQPATPTLQAPVARNDTATTQAGQPTVIDVLLNDTDPAGARLEVIRASPPQHGSARINADNTVVYVPESGFTGTDAFTYTLRNAAGVEAEAGVSVVVGSANRAPLATDMSATTRQDRPVSVDVLTGASDPDADPLTVTGLVQPASGSATIEPDGRRITYTAAPGFNGADSVAFTISDGRGGQVTARLRLTVEPVGPDRQAVSRVLDEVPCALVEPRVEGGVVTIRGMAGGGTDPATWIRRLEAVAGVERVVWSPQSFAPSQCPAVDLMRSLVAANRAGDLGLSITTARPVFREGENLTLTVRAPAFDAYLYIDYFTLDGHVVHMLPRPSATTNRVPGRSLKPLGTGGLAGEWQVGPPFGTEMLTVIASPVPLFVTVRDEIERTPVYTEALRDALARIGGRTDPGQPVVAAVAFTLTTSAR